MIKSPGPSARFKPFGLSASAISAAIGLREKSLVTSELLLHRDGKKKRKKTGRPRRTARPQPS
jgi:hypothetical protein